MALPLPFSLVLLSFVASALAQSTATVSPASQATSASGVSDALDAAYAGFGIEPSNLYSFTGGRSTNTLSVNLLQNLADYSGIPPHLRIGGNTADNLIYDSSFNSFLIQTKQNPTGQGVEPSDKLIFGPAYWEALNRFPKGTPITFALNLAYEAPDYIQNIVKEAKACLHGLKNVQLYSFEIGNEPDLYSKNGFRTGSWGGQVYTQEFLARAAAIYKQVLKPAGLPSNFFEAPATASTIGTTFEISDLVQDGITKGVNGSSPFVAGWNQHDYYYFVSVSPYDLTLDHLMQLSNSETQFGYWTTQVKQAQNTKLPYYLREMASAGPTGIEGISDTFGAALWTLNFFCYTATVGVASVEMHMTDNSYASAWQPITINDKAAHVRPSYYAYAAMTQLIGSGNGTTQIAALSSSNIPSGYSTYVRTYAAYTNGDLAAVVLINSMMANASDSSKGSLTFRLSLPSAKGQSLYLSTLTADGADSQSGVTWNGISYEQNSDGTPTTVDKAVHTVSIGSDGSASVTVRDSQAVIANIGYLLGSHDVLVKSPAGSKKSSATSAANGASTAAITSVVTTAIAFASSVSPSSATPTTTARSEGASARGRRWRRSSTLMMAITLVVALVAIHAFSRS